MKPHRCALLLLLAGCVDLTGAEKATRTGALLSVDWYGETDVVGLHLELERVACAATDAFSPARVTHTVDLLDTGAPGPFEARAVRTDPDSRHISADLFAAVEPGCWAVRAIPVQELGAEVWVASADCGLAEGEVVVADGQTAALTLLSQCVGDARGALDTVVALNHPPAITLIWPTTDVDGDGYVNDDDPEAAAECVPVELCAQVQDPDDDPIELEWRARGAEAHRLDTGEAEVVGWSGGARVWQQCLTLVPGAAGAAELEVSAWDLGLEDGAQVRIEALLAAAGAAVESRDTATAALTVSYVDDPLCFDESGALVRRPGASISREPGCAPTPPEAHYCGGGCEDDVLIDQLCEGGALKAHSLYPSCEVDAPPIIERLPGKRPALPDLSAYVVDDELLVVLGKALFWDAQVGSDGVACASCHYSGGGDIRLRNAVNPGPDGVFGGAPSGHPVSGPDQRLTADAFPFHALSDPLDRRSSILRTTDDRASSEGSPGSTFVAAEPAADRCTPRTTGPFFWSDLRLRQVEPRNSPTVINAVYNFRNFWDGRANNVFNGSDPFGLRSANADPRVGALVADERAWDTTAGGWVWALERERVRLLDASLASQAVGPPLSDFEMSCAGRSFADIARRLYGLRPLANQQVHAEDSVFSAFPELQRADGLGLDTTYADLIEAVFEERLWQGEGRWRVSADGRLSADSAGYTQMEHNLALFFGLAVQAYEATLISDQTPFDLNELSPAEARGLAVFVGQGKCVNCHNGPLFTSAAWSPDSVSGGFKQVERMIMGDDNPALYDNGFYNIGVRPTVEDIGVGAEDPFGNPLSFSRQWLDWKSGGARPIDPGVESTDACAFDVPFNTRGDCSPRRRDLPARVAVDGAFKTPTLRNVGLNPPYFHNGGTADLHGVVDFYNRGGDRRGDARTGDTTGLGAVRSNLDPDITRLGLSDDQRDDLVAFLLALTDPRVACHAGPFDHPALTLTEGSTRADSSPRDGIADDRRRTLPAVGEAGLSGIGRPCQANSGDLFGAMQDRFDVITR